MKRATSKLPAASELRKPSRTNERVIVPADADDETREIPFITHWRQGGEEGMNHWDIVKTGSFQEDCAIGEFYADQYLQYLREYPQFGDQGLLINIARDMRMNDPANHKCGVLIGFWYRIGLHLEDLAARLDAEEKIGRSEREQEAA